MNFNSSMSIDLNLVHSAQGISAQQLPVSQNTKKRLVGNDTPKSSRSRISTEALINYDQRQNAINMIRNQQNEGKKIKFSEMMDLPYVIINNEFVRRGKTFLAYKKIDLNDDNFQEKYKMKNIILKRTSPLQEIQTTKKLGEVFYRKKKQRQSGTLFSCELWSRPYYDHVLNKTELKQMHEKIQESSKCKNYDQRVNDVHRLFDKWEKQQPDFGINTKSFIIPDIRSTNITDNQYDANNHSSHNFEDSYNSSKKSRFFKAVLTEPDHYQDDSLIENTPQQNISFKEFNSFSQRVLDIQQNQKNKKSTPVLSFQLKNQQMDTQTNQKAVQYNSKNLPEKKVGLSQLGFSKGFLSQRAQKKSREQNTTVSTNIGDQSMYNDGHHAFQFENKFINKTPQSSYLIKKNQSQIKEVYKECSYLIKDCLQYKKESNKIKKQIDGYLNDPLEDKLQDQQKKAYDVSIRELLALPQ